MEAVYTGVNWFVERIGKPFPHEGKRCKRFYELYELCEFSACS